MRKFVGVALFVLAAIVTLAGVGEAANWKLSHLRPVDSTVDQAVKVFAEKVERGTDGRITIDIFGSNALGDYIVVHERVGLGSVEMAVQSMGTTLDRDLQLVNLSYLARDWDGVSRNFRLSSPMMQWVSERLRRQDIKLLGIYPAYFGGSAFSQEPPSPGDPTVPKNLKIRVPPQKVFELVGLSQNYIVTPLPFAEVFTALQSGMVDGVFGAGAEGYYSNFRDVLRYYVPTNTHFELWFHIMNLELFESLSPEDQQVVVTAAAEMEAARFDVAPAEQGEYEQMLADYGITVIRLTPEELRTLSDVAHAEVWPAMRDEVSEGMFDEFISFITD